MTGFQDKRELRASSEGMSRREFIRGVSGSLAGCILLTNGAVAAITRDTPHTVSGVFQRDPFTLNQVTFSRHLDEAFRVCDGSSYGIDVTLRNVQDLAWGNRGECFSVMFRGPLGRCLDQGTYRFEHNTIGAFDLFIVPMAQDHDAQVYEAVFNRLHT